MASEVKLTRGTKRNDGGKAKKSKGREVRGMVSVVLVCMTKVTESQAS